MLHLRAVRVHAIDILLHGARPCDSGETEWTQTLVGEVDAQGGEMAGVGGGGDGEAAGEAYDALCASPVLQGAVVAIKDLGGGGGRGHRHCEAAKGYLKEATVCGGGLPNVSKEEGGLLEDEGGAQTVA